jgi:hypothetical protein
MSSLHDRERGRDPERDRDEAELPPLEPDEALLQQYLDGTLEGDAALRIEERIAADPGFAGLARRYELLFGVLEAQARARAVARARSRSELAPPPPPASPRVYRGGLDAFGGLRGAAALFALADLALLGLLGTLLLLRGPLDLLRAWVLTLKDAALWLSRVPAPSGSALLIVPALMLGCAFGLVLVWRAMRRLLAAAEA